MRPKARIRVSRQNKTPGVWRKRSYLVHKYLPLDATTWSAECGSIDGERQRQKRGTYGVHGSGEMSRGVLRGVVSTFEIEAIPELTAVGGTIEFLSVGVSGAFQHHHH